jgi:hypothetical protein
MTNTRALQRLIERMEEFLDEYKTELDADEASTVDDAISVIDRIKTDLESGNDEEDDDYK